MGEVFITHKRDPANGRVPCGRSSLRTGYAPQAVGFLPVYLTDSVQPYKKAARLSDYSTSWKGAARRNIVWGS